MYVSQSTVQKLVPFAVVFDVSVAVALFGGYIDPTLRIVGIASCAVTAVVVSVIWFRSV